MCRQKFYCIIWLCVGMSGCSLTPLQSDFSCPYQDGESCLSISQADKKSTQGSRDTGPEKETPSSFCANPETRAANTDFQMPKRIPDRVARVWMAPFEDTEGNWHAASYVYTVSENAHWKPRGVRVPEALSKPVEKEALTK